MWVAFAFAKATHIFFSKNTCELDIVLTRTVNILTTNDLVKLTMFWTTGPRCVYLEVISYLEEELTLVSLLMLSMLEKNCSRQHIEIFFQLENRCDISCKLSPVETFAWNIKACLLGKIRKYISCLSSTEFAQRMVKFDHSDCHSSKYFLLQENIFYLFLITPTFQDLRYSYLYVINHFYQDFYFVYQTLNCQSKL